MQQNHKERTVPPTTIRRLSTYYRVLTALDEDGSTNQSSELISQLTGFTAAQVRRDLAYFGSFGKRGVGYAVHPLKNHLASILGITLGWKIGLIGVGNLGRALLAYRGFTEQGFDLVAAFDNSHAVIGESINGINVQNIDNLAMTVSTERIDIAIITVPELTAQAVVDQAVAAGIQAILNFAPKQLHVPAHVELSNVDLAMEVEYLSYTLSKQSRVLAKRIRGREHSNRNV